MRIGLPLVAICGAVTAMVGPAGASSTAPPPHPPVVARTIYVVRPDPRLCPSPLCGGYWVSRVNHARTRCHDGLFRPRCYVAVALDAGSREPLQAGVPADALVRAAIGTWPFDGFGELGAILVADVWAPVGREPPIGGFYRLRDTGVRCVRAPCFSVRAWRMNRPHRTTVSAVDLGSAHSSPGTQRRAEAALTSPEGLFAAGRIFAVAGGGRAFVASQVFLRVATPRA